MEFSTKNTLVLVCSLFCFGSRAEEEDEVSRTYAKEQEDVVLHCSSGNKESLEHSVVQWINKDGKDVILYELGHHTENKWCCQSESVQNRKRASLFYAELKKGNASMILRDTRIQDAGIYTCNLSIRPGRLERSRTKLIVGAVQAPVCRIVNVTKAGVDLQCVVRGSSSQPSEEWQTCEGKGLKSKGQRVSETRGRYHTTVFITVTQTQTNCFSCVVQQEDVEHRVNVNITLSGEFFEKTFYEILLPYLCFHGVIGLSALGLALYLYLSN